MTDLEAARAKREKARELAESKEVVALAEAAILALPLGETAVKRVTALSLAILAITDEEGADREAVAEAFSLLARNVAQIELVRV